MTVEDELYLRARRILTDGRRHSIHAIFWAREFTERHQRRDVRALERMGFTPREISLGSAEVVSL